MGVPDRVARPPFVLAEALAQLFESVHEGIYIGRLRGADDSTLAANPYLKLMFGHPPEADAAAIRPFEPERFVDPAARGAFFDRLARDGTVTDYLLRLRRADDSPFWVEATAQVTRTDPTSTTQDVFVLMRDVSERRRLEDQGRDLHNQLLQAEKLAALGQTVSGVAHELNNPLATILTWSERLAARSLDEVTQRGIKTILGESERAAKIVRNLLTFSRKRHTTRAMVDVNQIVRETLALRTYEQRVSNIATLEALADGLPPVFADPHQLKQVLLNLIINAEQAMLAVNGRGTLVIRTWQDPDRDIVLLEVNDDGPGVAQDVQAKIFDPFFTTKAVGEGTGLGLTVAYAIMQDHGGGIQVTSTPGAGASFTLELPAGSNRPSQTRSRAPLRTMTQPAGAGARVLVVEDETALATAMAEALRDAGFHVDRAPDGRAALERVTDGSYDLIVCDLKMPNMDGPAFYRALRTSTPAMTQRMVFVTGDVAGTEAEHFLEESGCPWLSKPFRLNELLRLAQETIDRPPA